MNNRFEHYVRSVAMGVSVLLLTACNDDKLKVSRAAEYPILQMSNFDANGGQWPTIILDAPSDISVAAPEATDSPTYLAEIEESKEIVKKRDYAQTCSINYWGSGSVLRWNEIARELIGKTKTSPPFAARVLSLLSVTQYDALVVTWYYKFKYRRPAPSLAGLESILPTGNFPSYPSEDAVIAATSFEILKAIFPSEKDYLYKKALEDGNCRLWAGANTKSDILAGGNLGTEVAKRILTKTDVDNNLIEEKSKSYWGRYVSENARVDNMSTVHTWFDMDVVWDNEVIPAPPRVSSEAFKKDIALVKTIAQKRTPNQRSTADFWSDGSVTIARWNERASELIHPMNYSELKAANILQLMNRSIHDAAIVSWQAKYKYNVPRPAKLDAEIKPSLDTPNAPSYISGHSTYSSAAATVLSHFFSTSSRSLHNLAEEAGLAGVYGGINYFFDHRAGVKCGNRIGELAIEEEQLKRQPNQKRASL